MAEIQLMQADWSVQNRTHYARPSPAFQETMLTKWQEERVYIACETRSVNAKEKVS